MMKYSRLRSSMILVLALGLFTACGSGGTDGGGALTQGDKPIADESIASTPEASGICYAAQKNKLFVVSDKGILYKLAMDGTIEKQQTYKTSKGKKYDMEGVACDDANGVVVVAIEGKDNVMTINQESFIKTPDTGDIMRPSDNTLYKDKDGKNGIEGISIKDTTVFISNQSRNAYPNQDASFIFTIDSYTAPHPTVQATIYDPKLKDIAGLAFYHDKLYILNDKDKLSEYDRNEKKVLKTKTLPIPAEGIAFDASGNIYFASDNNGKVYKYKASDFGIE